MKRGDWESIFSSDFCNEGCPREASKAATFIRDRHPEFKGQRGFSEKAIGKYIASNAWVARREEFEHTITRKWLSENIGEREEQRHQRDLAYLNSSDRIAAYANKLLSSIEEKGGRFKNPLQASLAIERAARAMQVAQDMSRRALGLDGDGGVAGDPFDNTLTIEVIPPEKLLPSDTNDGDHDE